MLTRRFGRLGPVAGKTLAVSTVCLGVLSPGCGSGAHPKGEAPGAQRTSTMGEQASAHSDRRRGPLPAAFVGIESSDIGPYVDTAAARARRDAEFRGMRAAGARAIRQSFDARGFTTRELPLLDEYVLAAASHHLQIIAVLSDSSRFNASSGSQRGYKPPQSFSRFARFAGALAHRYGANGTLWRGSHRRLRPYAIRVWQIWNEPNLPVYWQPKPSPRAYVRLVKACHGAIRHYDTHALLLSGGIPNSTQSKPLTYLQYLAAFLRAGGGRYVDAIGVHAYTPTVSELGVLLHRFRAVADRHHGRRLGLWITEFGWADAGPSNAFVVGRRGQATRIEAAYRLLERERRSLNLLGVVYFAWKDRGVAAGGHRTWGLQTGLRTRADRAKPAFMAWKRAVAGLP